MGCGAVGSCDGIQNGCHIGLHLGFYPKFYRRKLNIFEAGHVEFDITKHFATFFTTFCFYFFSPKKGKT